MVLCLPCWHWAACSSLTTGMHSNPADCCSCNGTRAGHASDAAIVIVSGMQGHGPPLASGSLQNVGVGLRPDLLGLQATRPEMTDWARRLCILRVRAYVRGVGALCSL